ncbi:epoxide hydrolase family protein [Streptomyces gilvus]|uniref:epoxide hydrolase family protein n=1 Tax=Streptomyces gilvus TaxID=2920937 RepID=UPI001F0EC109|nr:epoxide hydrolase [Streptomyces sp. CME 23]MCH5677954.1 epoxide hydrolase 1 [Streptomyces sp. CME 23]
MAKPPTGLSPFTIRIPDADVADLGTRLSASRYPSEPLDEGWKKGVPQPYLQHIAEHWRDRFDWRVQERGLNEHPQFLTEIDGQTFHLIHARSAHPGAIPLLLLHGWPGSVAEFARIIGPLTDPSGHGHPDTPSFHVVAPSHPGFAFSMPLTKNWTNTAMATAYAELMSRLGYENYLVQGGDIGAMIAPQVAAVDASRVLGVHLNAASLGFIPAGPVDDAVLAELDPLSLQRLESIATNNAVGMGYYVIQATKPQTLSYGLTDSPVGQLAWILEKFHDWTDRAHPLPEDAVDLDQMLTNVSLYWFTRTAGTSANWYHTFYSSLLAGADANAPYTQDVPVGVVAFREDWSIRYFGEQSHRITHWSDIDSGGHFAAMETPELLVADLRTFAAAAVQQRSQVPSASCRAAAALPTIESSGASHD